MHQQPAYSYEQFADPKRHTEIEGQDAMVEPDAQQKVRGDRWRCRKCEEPSLDRKIDGERDKSDDNPPRIVGEWHAEVNAWISVLINLP